MINRFRWFIEDNIHRLLIWVIGPWRICYSCAGCACEMYADMYLNEEIFWCNFTDKEVDPNGTCRAFKGWARNTDEI